MARSRLIGARLLERAAAPAAGLALGLLALGPGLGRGYVLSYDMVFVPRPPLTATAMGLAGGPPRAVPSDAVVDLLSAALPADLVQKLVLIFIFVFACSGAAALPRGLPLPARLAVGVCYAWNPYVAERLIIGQWALLLGYAGLPWVLRAIAAQRDAVALIPRLAAALLPAAVGGFAAMSVSALVAVPAALAAPGPGAASCPAAPGATARRLRAGRAGRVAAVLLVLAAASLPWVIPSLLRPVHTTSAGVAAFAARADTPFGSLGSLLMLGGAWNAETVPRGYGGAGSAFWLAVVVAGIAGYAARCRHDPRWPGLGVAALAGLVIAGVGVTAAGRDLLRSLIAFWPGFAVLRDGQQFVAPLALAEATGIGALVLAAIRPRQPFGINGGMTGRRRADGLPGAFIATAVILAPLLLVPGLAWGAVGRLKPVQYPAGWLRARAVIEADRVPGSVLLLPWAAYRRYGWNHGEAVLDPWPRLLSRTVIWNDAVQVGSLTIPAEAPQARRLNRLIVSGAPLTAALRRAGVRYVIVDAGPMYAGPTASGGLPRAADAFAPRLAGATTVLAGPDIVLYQLSGTNSAAG